MKSTLNATEIAVSDRTIDALPVDPAEGLLQKVTNRLVETHYTTPEILVFFEFGPHKNRRRRLLFGKRTNNYEYRRPRFSENAGALFACSSGSQTHRPFGTV